MLVFCSLSRSGIFGRSVILHYQKGGRGGVGTLALVGRMSMVEIVSVW